MPDPIPENGNAPTEPKVDLPPQGKYGLIGREEEIVSIGRAFHKSPTVLLTAPPGVGKTELACEFARREVDNSKAEGGVFFTHFEYGAGLSRILHEIGTTVRGITFARLPSERQRQWVVDYVNQNHCLLIWDSFQNVFRHLGDTESQEILDFLRDIGQGTGRILITGPNKDWADDHQVDYQFIELEGLNEPKLKELAGLILDGVAVDEAKLDPEYPELLQLLGGNPMAMRVVLPHLKEHPPSALIPYLTSSDQGEDTAVGIVDAALECCFSRMSPRTRTHLSFLALFRQRVLLDVVTHITQGEVYASVTGEEMGWGACRTLLREARDFGLLDSIPASIFLIPPSVSTFLRRQLERQLDPHQIKSLEHEFLHVYADLGDYFLESLASESSESAVTGVLAEEANLLRALELAQTDQRWDSAQLVLQPLAQVYKMQERVVELRRLRERLLSHVGPQAEQAKERGAIDSWMYLQGTEINDAISRGELDRADSICNDVLKYLESLGDAASQVQLASIFHNLGMVAQGRKQYDQAEDWYRKALEINEAGGHEAESADSYHQMGLMLQSQRRDDEAEEWHRKALTIREGLQDEGEIASECHQLGLIAESRLEFEPALEWFHRARIAYESVGDQAGTAAMYHRVGLIAQAHYDFEEAIGWYQRALTIYDELEDETSGADDYYQVGVMALHRKDYEEAEEWVGKALAAYELLGNETGLANCYHQLAVVAHAQRKWQEADSLYHRALDSYVQLDDEVAGVATWGQLGVLADQRGNYSHAVWYVAHTYEISTAHGLPLLNNAKKHLSSLRSRMGIEAFIESWNEVSDRDILSDLD